MEIKPYAQENLEAVLRLIRETLFAVNIRYYPLEEIYKYSKKYARENFCAMLRTRRVFVAFEDDVLCATGAYEPLSEGRCEVNGLFVCGDRIKQGLGTRMLLFLEAQARAQGARELFLYSTLGAKPFYEKFGYRALRLDKGYGYPMEKRIGQTISFF